MSLINDVLRDLERRKAEHAPGPGAPTPAARPEPRRWPIWLLMAVLAGGALHWMASEHLPRRASEPTLVAMTPVEHSATQPTEKTSKRTESPDEEPSLADPAGSPSAPDAVATERAPAISPDEARQQPRGPDTEPPPNDARGEHSREAAAGAPSPDESSAEAADASAGATADEATARVQAVNPSIRIEKAGEPERPEQDRLDDTRRAIARGHFELAESHARRLVAEQPQLTEGHRLLGRALLHQGRTTSAIEALETALGVAAAPAEVAALLGRVLIERGEVVRARGILESHRPDPLADPDYHLLLAATQRQAGDHAAAAETYRALGDIIPGNARVWIGLGASMESMERLDEAIAAYERALDSKDPPAARFARQRLEQLK